MSANTEIIQSTLGFLTTCNPTSWPGGGEHIIIIIIKALQHKCGPTACLKLLQKVCLKRWRKEKKSMTGPGCMAWNL